MQIDFHIIIEHLYIFLQQIKTRLTKHRNFTFAQLSILKNKFQNFFLDFKALSSLKVYKVWLLSMLLRRF